MSNIYPFTIVAINDYPNDQYFFAPSPDYINFDSGSLPVVNLLKFQKRYVNDVIPSFDYDTFNNYFAYESLGPEDFVLYSDFYQNIDPLAGPVYPETPSTVDFISTSRAVYKASDLRKDYKLPREFLVNYLQLDTNTNDSVGYMFYPFRLFLEPIGYTVDGSGWHISTKVKLMSSLYIGLQSNDFNLSASNLHNNFLDNAPTLIDLNSNLTSGGYTIKFTVSSCTMVYDDPIIKFTANPIYTYNKTLKSGYNINVDSTFVSYSSVYIDVNNTDIIVAQTPIGITKDKKHRTLVSNYILRYNSPVQTFQLIQSIGSATTDPAILKQLNQTQYCILSATLNLNTTDFNYYAKKLKIKQITNSNIGVSYIADGPNLYGTVTINSPFSLNTNIPTSSLVDQIVTWNLPYAPHHYSLKTTLLNNTNTYEDSFGLNFYLKTDVIDTTSTGAILSSYITSDHNILKYPLSIGAANDSIRYTIVQADSAVIPYLSAGYLDSSSIWQTYPLTASPWIPVSEIDSLTIDYRDIPNHIDAPLGATTLTIKTTLSSLIDNTLLDSFEVTHIDLAQDYTYSNGNGNGLFLDLISEESDSITIDASNNVSDTEWPYRDLSNTDQNMICWFYEPSSLNLSMNAVDQNGNVIQNIIPYTPIVFDSNSWKINLQGYGPNQVIVSLSSQYYNEVQTLSTNPSLFDYFTENKFGITPKIQLDNYNKIRTITLQTFITFKGSLYEIPYDIPLYWEWEYNDQTDPLLQPVSAFYTNTNDHYEYGTSDSTYSLSSINFKIDPDYADTNPKINKVKVSVYSSIKNPPVSGEYIFYVDDFPSLNVFNTDFSIAYTDNQNGVLMDSRNGTTTITRPSGTDFDFTITAYDDVIERSKYSSIQWKITDSNNSTAITVSSTQGSFINIYNLDLTPYPAASATYVTLSVLSALVPGWLSSHNLTTSAFIYAIDPNIFYKPFEFILYPEYAWLDGEKLTFLDPTNYTLSVISSAYDNKKSNSYNFWLSANNDIFNKYLYQNSSDYSVVSSSSAFDILPISYDPVDTSIYFGINVSLSAFNDTTFPQSAGTVYLSSLNGILSSLQFNNFAQTINREDILPENNPFSMSPYLINYEDVNLTHTLKNNNIDLDIDKNITFDQDIQTIPQNSPAKIIGGDVNYFLSNAYWTVSATVPAVTGTFTPFILNPGDPLVPLYTGENGVDNLTLTATASLCQQIPPSTFDNYIGDPKYPKDPDLWNIVILN